MIETRNVVSSAAEQASLQSEKMLEKLYVAAQPGAVFAPPVVAGAYTIITASEVAAGGGFGFGAGSGPAQIGQQAPTPPSEPVTAGGGGSRGRPVAAIIISADGVKVQPIVDATKIALAAIAAWISVGLMAMRLARTKKR
jgi:uncharacterized spore protein YtfJ